MRDRTSTAHLCGAKDRARRNAVASRRRPSFDRSGALSTSGLRPLARRVVRRPVKPDPSVTNDVASCHRWPCDRDVTPRGCDSRRHVDLLKVRPFSGIAWRRTSLVTSDARPRSWLSARREPLTDSRVGPRVACPHAARASSRDHLGKKTLWPGRRSFWARERVLVNSARVEHSGEICGLGALDEREDSMRSRASLPFGPLRHPRR